MGSSIGNFTPDEAASFIAQFALELRPEDVMLIALDGCQDADKVYHAYNVSSFDYTTVTGWNFDVLLSANRGDGCTQTS